MAHVTSVPTEIIYAFDLVPLLLTSSTWQMAFILKNYQECLDFATECGIVEETCSGHRVIGTFAFKGWYPPPVAFIYATGGCDAFSGSPRVIGDLYDVPTYCLDTPYQFTEDSYAYLTHELEGMVELLEEVTGRKIDWDKLTGMLKKSKRQYELFQEIRELRKEVPSPMENRRAWQLNWMNWIYAGSDDGILFFETLRDELKDRVEKQTGVPGIEEKFRILDLFMPPAHALKLLDWMQKDYGVNIVSETLIRYDSQVEWDFDKPLDTIARKWCGGPLWNELSGSTDLVVKSALEDAEAYKATGAIWWDNNACRQCGAIRMVKDGLIDNVGIPTVEVVCDIGDPAFVTVDEMKSTLVQFFEMLERRK